MVLASAVAPEWVHPAERFPEPVRTELAHRRAQILDRAEGRILDLDDPAAARRFVDAGRTVLGGPSSPRAVDPPGTYDTVIATGVLAAFADLGAITAALVACLDAEGELLFVEPVGRPGWPGIVRATAADLRHRREPWHDLHLDRDVLAAVRLTGLVVCDADRGDLPDQPPSLRHWVSGRALRIRG